MRYLLFFFLSFLLLAFVSDDAESVKNHILKIREERNAEMRDTAHSPLKPEEIAKFKELHFFDIDLSYRVVAEFRKAKKKEAIEIPTSSGKLKKFYVLGKAMFRLKEKACTLTVYRLASMNEGYFIPFTDLTGGNECYGGGRYIDAEKAGKNKLLIDFNLCYNPYCAYTTGYNCPIPPKENFIDLEIKAGEKLLWDDH